MQKPKHILLADDDSDDTDIFAMALKSVDNQCKLTVVHDGNSLFSYLACNPPPDLIVLDLIMPGITGKECVLKLRADSVLNRIPVVMLSILYNPDSVSTCLLYGANYYFEKESSYKGMEQIIKNIYSLAGTTTSHIKDPGIFYTYKTLKKAS